MVSKALQNLSDDDLHYIEQLLGEALGREIDADKTWKSKNGYARPFQKQRQILNCLNAVKSTRDLKRKLSIKW